MACSGYATHDTDTSDDAQVEHASNVGAIAFSRLTWVYKDLGEGSFEQGAGGQKSWHSKGDCWLV
jgi:hypothetical protein